MGIKNLLKFLNHFPDLVVETDINEYTGKKIAIDISILLYQVVISVRNTGTDLTNKQGEITSHIVKSVTNNIVKLKIDMNISQEDLDVLLGVLTKLKPEGLTVDYDINFNRLLENTEDKEDLSGIDVEQAIEEFVNMLDIDNKKDIIDYTLGLYERSKL